MWRAKIGDRVRVRTQLGTVGTGTVLAVGRRTVRVQLDANARYSPREYWPIRTHGEFAGEVFDVIRDRGVLPEELYRTLTREDA